MKIENIPIEITVKQLITVIIVVFTAGSFWFKLQSDINDARNSPMTKLESEMKFEMISNSILDIDRRVERLEE